MPYDALGNYIPGDEDAQDTRSSSPLDTVKGELKKIAAQSNPMLAPLYLRDVGRIGVNMASPLIGATAGALSNLQSKGAEYLHRMMGNEASALEAQRRMVRPDSPEQAQRFYMPLQTPVGQAIEESVGKTFDTLHLPPMGPGSGMPGSAPVSPRPMLTPNDVRVMGAEATRVARQVRDIPTDFQNAQSGFTRIDPITNQPTVGARLQGAAEDVGRIVEGRQGQGLSAVPGVPTVLTPETSMYAIRPQGSRMMTPVVPESARGYNPENNYINDVITDVIDPNAKLSPPQVMHEIDSRHLSESNSEPHLRLELKQGLRDFTHKHIEDMFPDAPSFKDAKDAYEVMFSDREARAANAMKIYDAFLETPEGQRLKGALNLPTTGELEARHDAAANWLTGQFSNYLTRNVGTEGDPLVKLASQGLTLLPSQDVSEDALRFTNSTDLRAKRREAGMPEETQLETAEQEKFRELQAVNQELQNLETERQRLFELAHAQGLEDPAQMPEYAATTAPIQKTLRKRDKLQHEFDNMQLGIAYEKLSDSSVKVQTAEQLKNALSFAERQFFPSLAKTPDTEKVYTPRRSALNALGFSKIAHDFYEDVMSGKLPLDKIAKTPVDAYVRKSAEARIAKEKAAKLEAAQYVKQAEQNLKKTFDAHVPNDKIFGNVGALEITNAMPNEQITQLVSQDTAVLDHCIGQGGRASQGTKNPWFPKTSTRTYEPIYDLATGARNPKASRDSTIYVDNVRNGGTVTSFRDSSTGLPVATFDFHRDGVDARGEPKYYINYASGYQNNTNPVDAQYVDGIKSYLNSRSDSISRSSGNVIDNLGIYDMQSSDELQHLRRDANLPMLANEFRQLDFSGLPRFVTVKDLKDYMAGNRTSTAVAPAAPQATTHLTTDDAAWVHGEITSARANAVRFAEEEYGEATARRVENVINRAINAYLPEGHLVDETPQLMSGVRDDIQNAIAQLINQPAASAQNAAHALEEFVTDFEGIRGYTERRLEALRQQQNQTSEQHRALQDVLQHPDTEHLRATVFAMDGIPNDFWGQMAADERRAGVQQLREEIARRESAADGLTADIENPITNAQGGVFDSVAASREYNIPATLAREIAARLGEATESSIRTMLTAAQNRMARTIFDPTFMPTEAQAGAIRMLEDAQTELQIFGRADTGGMHFNQPEGNVPAVGDFEVDNTHPANQPIPPRPREVMNAAIARIATEQGMQVAERIETIAVRIAEARYSPNRHPQDFIQALREAADREPSELVERGLYDVADQIETSLIAQNRPPAQPAPAQNALQELSDHDLHQRLLAQAPTTDIWRRLNTRTDELALLARENNVSPEGMQQTIRGGAANLAGFSDVEREYMAREVGNLIRLYEREQQARLPAPEAEPVPEAEPENAPLVATFVQIPERVRNMTYTQLSNNLTADEINEIEQLSDQIVRNNSFEEIQNIIGLVRSFRIGGWEDFMPAQREYLARTLEDIDELGMPPPEQPQRLVNERETELAGDIMANVEMHMREQVDIEGLDAVRYNINDMITSLREGRYADALGDLMVADTMSDALRSDLIGQLESLRSELEDEYDGDGHANGGPVRGYKEGGQVADDDAALVSQVRQQLQADNTFYMPRPTDEELLTGKFQPRMADLKQMPSGTRAMPRYFHREPGFVAGSARIMHTENLGDRSMVQPYVDVDVQKAQGTPAKVRAPSYGLMYMKQFADGGPVHGLVNDGIVPETPSLAQMRAALMTRS